MKKKAKSNPKKPQKAAAKKSSPKKPAAKKPASKKPAAKKPAKKKVVPKKAQVKAKPQKKIVIKAPVKVPAKAPKAELKKSIAKSVAVKAPVKQVKTVPAQVAEAPKPKPKRPPPAPKKRFIVLPTRPMVPSEVKDDGKQQKGLYKLEYIVYSSPDVLFEFISTAGGLEKWFAPKVFLKDNVFIFSWGNDEQKQARLLALKEREFVRFRWLDQSDKKYFEFRLQIDDLTSEVALIVSDFADTKEEFEDAKLLWNAQIQDLLHALGSP